jgi:hypothetical protein
MASETLTRPELVAHPLRTQALAGPHDFEVNASFRTFNPGYDPQNKAYTLFPWLVDARVALVIRDPGGADDVVILCETDGVGELRLPGTTDYPVIQNAAQYKGRKIHFEVQGPKGSSDDMRSLKYSAEGSDHYFPIATWSTEGWLEPGPPPYPGSFPVPVGAKNLGENRHFTVGCFIDLALKFKRGNGKVGTYPENADLKAVVDSGATVDLVLRPGGILRANVFEAKAGKRIEIAGYFNAAEIKAESISSVTGDVSITPKTGPKQKIPFAKGEMFGLPMVPAASEIQLFKAQGPIPFPETLTDQPPRLVYKDYKDNKEGTYQNLTTNQKTCVYYNWFLEFIGYRNLFIRAMSSLTSRSTVEWTGVDPLTLFVDDGAGGAFATGQTITAHLEFVMKPRDDVCIHEMAHAFASQYLVNSSSRIYYPWETKEHHMASYSHEFFAFQEGFAQFVASMFMDPDEAYLLYPGFKWPNLIQFTSPAAGFYYYIEFGFDDTQPISFISMENGIGLAVEGGFSASLTNIWRYLWNQRSTIHHTIEQPWVQNLDGGGQLDGLTAGINPNGWLSNKDFQERFAAIVLDPIVDAATAPIGGKINNRVSTRRVIDRIGVRASTAPWPVIDWTEIKPLLADFRCLNDFYISTIAAPGAAAADVVRWRPDVREYHFPIGAPPVVLATAGDTILQLEGIRITPSFGVKLRLGNSDIAVGQPNWTDQYRASVKFAAVNLVGVTIPVGAGPTPFDLLFESNSTPNETLLFKGVAVT